MKIGEVAIAAAENMPLPDAALRFGISRLVGHTSHLLSQNGATDSDFAAAMAGWPVATHVDQANQQHYELPPAFFELVLGPRKKYSCCLYRRSEDTLAEAEIAALEESCAHADLKDGQTVLELGCGWGSLSLFLAERYPRSRIVSVSNSASQRRSIEDEIDRRGLRNLTVITADMNIFASKEIFDRIVSIEMFEHMSNWHELLLRARSWIKPDGGVFIHVFSHAGHSYRFDHDDKADWIAQHFFTGGVMPSHNLIRQFEDCFTVERDWRWNGKHYKRTASDWLMNFDRNRESIGAIFRETYGDAAPVWMRRWRLFFLATAGLFGYADGEEWGVSHYLLRPVKH